MYGMSGILSLPRSANAVIALNPRSIPLLFIALGWWRWVWDMARAPGPTLGPGAPLFAGGLAPKSLGLGVWLWLQSALGCGEAPQLSAAIGLWSLGINAHPHCDFFLTPWWIWWNQLGTPYQNISKSNFHSDSFPSFPIFPPFRVCPHPQPQGKSYNHNLDSVTLPSNSSCCRDDEEWVDGWTCIGKWELQWRPSMMKNSKWGDHEHWILCIYIIVYINNIYIYIYHHAQFYTQWLLNLLTK